MFRSATRESELARARVASLKTNRVRASQKSQIPTGTADIVTSLRTRWGEIATNGLSYHDLLAGVTVAAVAITLNVALAKSAGVPASYGLIAGAIGGFFAAAFGGSNYQVSGPAAALNVMVFNIVAQFGPTSAAAAALVCGVVSIALGVFGLGRYSNLLPKIVLAGFTTGVGLTLLNKQVPLLLGSEGAAWHIVSDFWAMEWLREVNWNAVVCGLIVIWVTLALANLKSFPSSLLGIMIATFIAFELDWTTGDVGTFACLPEGGGQLSCFWSTVSPFPDSVAVVGDVGFDGLDFGLPVLAEGASWFGLIAVALPLALLSAAESLISAKAVDEMSNHKSGYNANAELFGQGIGNLASGLFGGLSVTGVIVRSSVNLQAGARTRIAAMAHGVLLLVAVYFFGNLLSVIPVSALAGLLVTIAWRLMKLKMVFDAIKTHKLHALAFVAAAVGTVMNYLMTGLVVGTVLYYLDKWMENRAKSAKSKDSPVLRPSPTIRAVINTAGRVATETEADPSLREQAVWSRHVRTKPKIHPTAYVHPTASVIGWVELGREVNVAADTSVRADEGAPFYIGDRSNVQDGVVLHALKDKWVVVEGRRWAIYIGSDCSLAHQALVHGPSMIGKKTFIGFKAIVHDSIVGEGCFISHGAVVVGVEIPPGKRVPSGWIVDSPAKVAELPDAENAHAHFNEDVVQVNRGLVVAYSRHTDPAPHPTHPGVPTVPTTAPPTSPFQIKPL